MESAESEAIMKTAVILAGGRSSRMGFDKQLLEKDHKTLVTCLAEELLKVFGEVLVVTKTPQLYEKLAVSTCSDIYPGEGPLSGIHSAFHHCSSEYLFVLACDMTQFSPEYASYQASRMLQEQTQACVTMRGERMEPFHGFYRRTLLADMEERLKNHKTSIFHLLEHHEVTRIQQEEMRQFADPDQLFRNLNTPEDYRIFRNESSKTGKLSIPGYRK